MAEPISLVRAAPNAKLIAALHELIAEAEKGVIIGLAGVKLRPDNAFATIRCGDCSDLELSGALSFAQHDLIATNPKRKP